MLTLFSPFNFSLDFPLKDIASYAIGVLATFGVLFTIYQIIKFLVKKIERKSNNEIHHVFRKNLQIPVLLLISIIALWLPFTFTTVPEEVAAVANKILTILIILNFAMISIRLVRLIKYLVLKKYDIEQKDNLKARKIYTQFKIIERILVFIILIVSISLILMTFSAIRKIGVSIIASAGLTGIILGFAAQKVIGGVLAGVQLALTQPIRLDDVVVVENEWGRIEEINLTYVVVRIWDQRRLILPSTYFIEKPFQNWTRTTAEILGTVYIYTDYNVPLEKIREELTRLLQDSEYWDRKTNVIQVTDATEKTVEIRVLVSSPDSSSAWDLRVYLREHLIKFLQENYPDSLPRSRVSITNDAKKE
ncbi:MAG: mechanosensitive ion channel [Bacteroidales bacterium]|nr:mechanosensitive ion channel [Bacteroidales bacterium]